MIELKCENCGAPIDPITHRCGYCGTQYHVNEERVIIMEHHTSPVLTFQAKMVIPAYGEDYYNDRTLGEIAMKPLISELSKSLAEGIEVYTWHDVLRMERHILGRVRVLKPDFKF